MFQKRLRRGFIKVLSLGLAGGYLGLKSTHSLARMGGGGGGSGVIDPPIGSILKDPVEMPNLSTSPGIVEVDLEARIAPININGTIANLMTYNGFYPGPTINVNREIY